MACSSEFVEFLLEKKIRFYAGVPDSILKDFIWNVSRKSGVMNIPATNEGEAVALCAGYHLATGGIPLAYMQNSGLGNAVNPLTSLVNKEVYSIPILLLIGMRGENPAEDEPQHSMMGKITTSMLDSMEIPYQFLDAKFEGQINGALDYLKKERSPYAVIIKKNLFSGKQQNEGFCSGIARESAIEIILDRIDKDTLLVSTTGLTSRELFELREKRGEGHNRDFYNIGAMGHCSAIAAGMALGKKSKKIVVLDGDGAILMHTGNLATIGHLRLGNLLHIVFDNNSYESTGAQPSAARSVKFKELANALNYKNSFFAENEEEFIRTLDRLLGNAGPALLVVKTRNYSRKNIGRPTLSPLDSKYALMRWLHDY